MLPMISNLVFILTTLLTIFLFYRSAKNSKVVLFVVFIWVILQSLISLSGFYTVTTTFPPRLIFALAPVIFGIIFLFVTPKGRMFLFGLDQKTLTLLHVVRIPVEIVLFLLFLQKKVPRLMTFEGLNFDILSGITALFIFYFSYRKPLLSKQVVLLWNFICLALLVNIVTIAILSTPFPFQKLAFDQANTAVLYFPYVLLPTCIVPLVLLSHLAVIFQLLNKR
jgi:hypothetical protein